MEEFLWRLAFAVELFFWGAFLLIIGLTGMGYAILLKRRIQYNRRKQKEG